MTEGVQSGHHHKPATPWPTLRVKLAAQKLGVSGELIEGLLRSGKIRGVRTTGKSGRPVWLACRADIDALWDQMHGRPAKV